MRERFETIQLCANKLLILNRIINEGNTWNYSTVYKQMIDVK